LIEADGEEDTSDTALTVMIAWLISSFVIAVVAAIYAIWS